MSKIDFDTIIYNEHSHLDGYSVYDERQIKAIKSCMKQACNQVLDEASERFETNGNDPIYESVRDEILQIKEEL